MDNEPIEGYQIQIYVDPAGKQPYVEWFCMIRDASTRARLAARLDKVKLGNLGDHKPVGGGVHELREHHGGGHRIYFGFKDTQVILLLAGGIKKTQQRDIDKALALWNAYQQEEDSNAQH